MCILNAWCYRPTFKQSWALIENITINRRNYKLHELYNLIRYLNSIIDDWKVQKTLSP